MKKLFVSVVALLAAVSLSAQDVTAIYNEAAAAFGACIGSPVTIRTYLDPK